MFDNIREILTEAGWFEVLGTALDILIVYYIIYRILLLIKGTKAVQMLMGLIAIIVFFFASKEEYLNLPTLHWLLDKFIGSFILIIVVIFQDDIRRGLSQFGKTSIFSRFEERSETQVIEEVVKASTMMANARIGALMVIQRDADLTEFGSAAVGLDARVSKDLLFSIFLPTHQNPLHDGAVLLQGDRIVAAGCFLPLTNNPNVEKTLGTRHRAAIGLSERTDAAIVMVSEESGTISVVYREELLRGLDATTLREVLHRIFSYAKPQEQRRGLLVRWFQRKPERNGHRTVGRVDDSVTEREDDDT